MCRWCEDSPGTYTPYTSNVTCVQCGHAVCLDHIDARALAQRTCQTCLSDAEFSSTEEEFGFETDTNSDTNSEANSDANSDANSETNSDAITETTPDVTTADHGSNTNYPAPRSVRILPLWMRSPPIQPSTARLIHAPKSCEKPYAAPSLRETCAVCLFDFVEGELVQHLTCHATHMFHTTCINMWWQRSRTCPMCKKNQ